MRINCYGGYVKKLVLNSKNFSAPSSRKFEVLEQESQNNQAYNRNRAEARGRNLREYRYEPSASVLNFDVFKWNLAAKSIELTKNVSLIEQAAICAFITHKMNSLDTEGSYIFIHVFAGGVSYAGITPTYSLLKELS
jgi:hypothetical protein